MNELDVWACLLVCLQVFTGICRFVVVMVVVVVVVVVATSTAQLKAQSMSHICILGLVIGVDSGHFNFADYY